MLMSPGLRKLALTTHVTSSLGWFGAVASFLVLAASGLAGASEQTARSAYQAMELITWWMIIPLCLAALLTGLIQSLGTPWGLFRHYWVLVKLILTVFATVVLLVHTQPIGVLASAAAHSVVADPQLRSIKVQLVVDATAALFVLLVATALAVYKPKGVTPYGWRRSAGGRAAAPGPMASAAPEAR
jgi:hypothetical protein